MRTSRRYLPWILGVVLTFVMVPIARADTLFNNLGAQHYSAYEISNGILFTDSFSTDASAFDLRSVTLLLAVNGSYPAGSDTLIVDLFADSSNSPGQLLETIGTLDTSQISYLVDYAEYTFNTSYALAADSRYWIGLTTSHGTAGFAIWEQSPEPGWNHRYRRRILWIFRRRPSSLLVRPLPRQRSCGWRWIPNGSF